MCLSRNENEDLTSEMIVVLYRLIMYELTYQCICNILSAHNLAVYKFTFDSRFFKGENLNNSHALIHFREIE